MKRFAKDPFSLMAFHRVLIGTAVAACLFYGAMEFFKNVGGGGPQSAILRGSVAWLLAAGLVFYLWRMRKKK